MAIEVNLKEIKSLLTEVNNKLDSLLEEKDTNDQMALEEKSLKDFLEKERDNYSVKDIMAKVKGRLKKETVIKEQSWIIVKNKGQITIPVKIRKKYRILEGTRLKVVATKDGVLLRSKKTIWDMIGAFPVDPAEAAKMDKELYDLRHEKNDE